jgi:putative membrane protein
MVYQKKASKYLGPFQQFFLLDLLPNGWVSSLVFSLEIIVMVLIWVDNVPIIMGINWVILSLATRGIIQRFFKLPIMKILVSSVLMVSLDVLLEPLAPQLDYWSFDTMVAPLSNYMGWLIYSLLIQILLELVQFKGHFMISLHILIIQLLFFGSLYFLF